MSKTHRVASVAVFALAFVVNPALFTGCQLGPDFGEKEVVALVQGAASAHTYRFTNDGADYELTLDLAQAAGNDTLAAEGSQRPSVVRVAHACSDRTFLRSAAACLDVTKVPLEGTITLARTKPTTATLVDHQKATAELRVVGTRIASAPVNLQVSSSAMHGTLHGTNGKSLELDDVVVVGPASQPAMSYRRQ